MLHEANTQPHDTPRARWQRRQAPAAGAHDLGHGGGAALYP